MAAALSSWGGAAVLLLLLLGGCDQAHADEAGTNVGLGHARGNSFKRSVACAYNQACTFRATLETGLSEHAVTHAGQAKKAKANVKLDVTFVVRSQCGSKDQLAFKLNVVDMRTNGKNVSSTFNSMMTTPVLFIQRNGDGEVLKVITSAHDNMATRTLKLGLVKAITRTMHKKALPTLNKMTVADTASYDIETEETAGVLHSKHIVQPDGLGGFVLIESGQVESGSSDFNNKPVNHRGKPIDMKQKRNSHSSLDENGLVVQVKQEDTLRIGSVEPLNPPPVDMTGSTGVTHIRVTMDIDRTDIATHNDCVHQSELTESDLETTIEHAVPGPTLHGSLDHSMTPDELRDADHEDDEEDSNPGEALEEATELIAAGTFEVQDLVPLMREDTIDGVMDKAWQMAEDQTISTHNMQKVIAAVASTRCKASYSELSRMFADHHAPVALRQQAAVGLMHHPDEDAAPPQRVIDDVRRVASRAKDPLASEATLLLGTLVGFDPESDAARQQASEWQNELAVIDANDHHAAARATTLIGALANIGIDESTADSLERFSRSEIPQLRHVTHEALGNMDISADEFDTSADNSDSNDFSASLELLSVSNSDEGDDSAASRLLTKELVVSGSQNFPITARARLGIVSGANNTAGFAGNVLLNAGFLDTGVDLLEVGYNGNVRPKKQSFGTEGQLSLWVKVRGKRVVSKNFDFLTPDLKQGGQCPKSALEEGSVLLQKKTNTWYKKMFQLNKRFSLGAVAVRARIVGSGKLGYKPIFSGAVDCQSPNKKQDVSVVAGVAPTADITYKTLTDINMQVARFRLTGDLGIFKGSVPAYSASTESESCAEFDSHFGRTSGKLMLNARVDSRKWDHKFFDGNDPNMNKDPLSRACKPFELGRFIIGPNARAVEKTEAMAQKALDKGEDIAQGAQSDGERTRDAEHGAGSEERSTERNQGASTRATERSEAAAEASAVDSAGASVRATARSGGEAERKVARNAESREEEAMASGGASLRAESRREEQREEAAVSSTGNAEKRQLDKVASELKSIEEGDSNQQMRDALRRDDKREDEREKKLEGKMERQQERARARREERRERRYTEGLASSMRREGDKEAEERKFDHLGNQERREMGGIASAEERQRERQDIRRAEDSEGEVKTEGAAIKKEEDREARDATEQERIQRMEANVEDSEKTTRAVRRGEREIEGEVGNVAAAETKQERQIAQQLKQQQRDAEQRALGRREEDKQASLLRHEGQREQETRAEQAAEQTARNGFQAARQQERGEERRLDASAQQRQDASTAANGMQIAGQQERAAEQRQASSERAQGREIGQQAQRQEQSRASDMRSNALEGTVGEAEHLTRQEGRQDRKEQRQGARGEAAVAHGETKQIKDTIRREGQAQTRSNAAMEQRLDKSQNDALQNQEAFTRDQLDQQQRRQATVSGNLRRVNDGDKERDAAILRQMGRQDERVANRLQRSEDRIGARQNRIGKRSINRDAEGFPGGDAEFLTNGGPNKDFPDPGRNPGGPPKGKGIPDATQSNGEGGLGATGERFGAMQDQSMAVSDPANNDGDDEDMDDDDEE